jgi:hypothetical protein
MKKKEMNALFDLFKAEFPDPPVYIKECPHDYKSDDGLWICCNCHRIERGMVQPFIEYKDRTPLSSPYDKLTHFKEKLEEISGLSLLIPDEVMKVCLSKTPEEVKVELQRHKLKKYYSYVYVILRQKGIVIPTLLQNEKDRLIRMFRDIEMIYSRIKKKSNMIAYHFLLSKMFPMIGRNDIVPYLYKLHSKRKVKEYESLWNKILELLS